MKYHSILLILAAAITCAGLSGCDVAPAQNPPQHEQKREPVSFVQNHAAGLNIAQQEGKPTLIFFSVPNNVGSQRMMETTFCDEEIKRLAERFVCIQVDASQESMLCESLKIASFPTVLLSNTNGTEVRRLVGKQTAEQLAVQMHVILQTRALRPMSVR